MSLDAAFYPGLWDLYAATGGSVRPEYLLPVLYGESGFQSVQNAQGADYWGINQESGSSLRSKGIDPLSYLSWPASEQLRVIITPRVAGQVQANGPIRSATRLYQGNLAPASLPVAFSFPDIIAAEGGTRYQGGEAAVYSGNKVLDLDNSHTITVGDLAAWATGKSHAAAVLAAIAKAYLVPGSQGRPHDPVLGEDFDSSGRYIGGAPGAPLVRSGGASSSSGWGRIALGLGILGVAGASGYWYLSKHPRVRRRLGL